MGRSALGRCNSTTPMTSLRLLQSMKRIGLILLAGFCLSLAPAQLAAQSDDPSEVFLKAYMTSQQGEKLEHDNQLQTALAKFRFAGSLLEELKKTHGDWQRAIVDYRSRKISENILRVQGKLGTQKDLAATTSAPPPVASNPPTLPQKPGPPEPNVQAQATTTAPPVVQNRPPPAPASEPSASVASDAVIKEATKKLQDKVDQLQAELEKSRSQYDTVAKEKDTLNGRLQETNTKLEQAQNELEKTKGAEKEARGQLAQAEDSLKKIAGSDKQDSKKQEALRAEIAQLKKALASAEKGRAAAEKEKDAESAKVTAVTKERNQLLADLKTAKQAQERVQVLVTENSDLKTKLALAEKTVREIGADKPKKEQEVAEVKRQLRLQIAVLGHQDLDPFLRLLRRFQIGEQLVPLLRHRCDLGALGVLFFFGGSASLFRRRKRLLQLSNLSPQRFLFLGILFVTAGDFLQRIFRLGELAARFFFGALGFLQFVLGLLELRVRFL